MSKLTNDDARELSWRVEERWPARCWVSCKADQLAHILKGGREGGKRNISHGPGPIGWCGGGDVVDTDQRLALAPHKGVQFTPFNHNSPLTLPLHYRGGL